MATQNKRMMVSLLPEWDDKLLKLKKEKFYNTTKSEMIRYLIGLGIEEIEHQTISEPTKEKPAS